MNGLDPSPSEDLALSFEGANYRGLLEQELFLTGNIDKAAKLNHDSMAVYSVALQHKLATLRGFADPNVVVAKSSLWSQNPEAAKLVWTESKKQIVNINTNVLNRPGVEQLPAWLIDSDMSLPLSLNAARWLRSVYKPSQLLSFPADKQASLVAIRMMIMNDCMEAYRRAMGQQLNGEGNLQYALLAMEMHRTALSVDEEVAGRGILEIVRMISDARHHLSWSDAYATCREYFSALGNQYGMVTSQKKAILAIETLNSKKLKGEMEAEERRLKLNPPTVRTAATSTTDKLIDFIESPLPFLQKRTA